MLFTSVLHVFEQTNPHKTVFGPVAKYWPVDLVQTDSGALTAWDDAIQNAKSKFTTMTVCHFHPILILFFGTSISLAVVVLPCSYHFFSHVSYCSVQLLHVCNSFFDDSTILLFTSCFA